MTLLESLQSLTNYPVSPEYVEGVLTEEGMSADTQLTPETAHSAGFLRAKRRVCLYIATAPNLSQGGISYSLDANARGQFIEMASDIAEALSEDEGGRYGYIGDEL